MGLSLGQKKNHHLTRMLHVKKMLRIVSQAWWDIEIYSKRCVFGLRRDFSHTAPKRPWNLLNDERDKRTFM